MKVVTLPDQPGPMAKSPRNFHFGTENNENPISGSPAGGIPSPNGSADKLDKITRKSTHRCARFACITCLTCPFNYKAKDSVSRISVPFPILVDTKLMDQWGKAMCGMSLIIMITLMLIIRTG